MSENLLSNNNVKTNRLTSEDIELWKQRGWLITNPVGISNEDLNSIKTSIIDETFYCVFGSSGEYNNAIKCPQPTKLFVDPKLREQYLQNPKCIWRNNFSQNPKISKSTGMINLYHNVLVRDKILFNLDIYNIIHELYTSLFQKENKDSKNDKEVEIAYVLGPERVGIKTYGTTDMPRHIDSRLFNDLDQTTPTRVQSIFTLDVDRQSTSNGSIEVLEGFHNYWELGKWFFTHAILRETNNKANSLHTVPQQLPGNFDGLLSEFLIFLQYIYENGKDGIIKVTNPTMQKSLQKAFELQSLPDKLLPIRWVKPLIQKGQMFSFDTRLPHCNTKNTTSTDRVVAYISFFPIGFKNSLYQDHSPKSLFLGYQDGIFKGSNRDNTEEQQIFGLMWKDRTDLKLTLRSKEEQEHIRKILLMK
jgi:hypothetical protein